MPRTPLTAPLGLLLVFGLLFSATGHADMQIQKFADILYANVNGRPLHVDIYLPAGKQSPYLVVWIHGGAWHSGSKDNPPQQLLAKGFSLASVEYRKSIEAPFPAQIHDIKAAIRFLRANAQKYGYRADNIAVWGSSAGGHLAALVGVTNHQTELEGNLGEHTGTSSAVQAAIDYFGPTNFSTILAQSTPHGISVRAPALALLLGKPVEQAPELARLASPVFHVDREDPPMLIMHGDQDNQVPINQSHELEGAFKAHGAHAKLVVVHGAGHSSPDYFEPACIDIAAKFLTEAFQNSH